MVLLFICFIFTPKIGEMIQFWRAYFSDGLVQPPTITKRLIGGLGWWFWIPRIPENERDCYLGVSRLESQSTKWPLEEFRHLLRWWQNNSGLQPRKENPWSCQVNTWLLRAPWWCLGDGLKLNTHGWKLLKNWGSFFQFSVHESPRNQNSMNSG